MGTPRSGTTLVQRLACELDGVKVPPETHLLSVFALRIGRADPFPWSGQQLREGLRRYVALGQLEGAGPDPGVLYDALGGRAATILDLLDAVVEAMAPGRWLHGEKSPEHLQWARLLAAARTDLKLICVVRDPRAVFASQRETRWIRSDPARSAMRWVLDQREVRHLRRALPGRVLAVRYEDVVTSPEGTKERIGAFLDVVDHAGGTTPSAEALYRPGETWKSLSTGEISASRTERWRDALTPSEAAAVETVAGREMARWGYAPECRTAPGWSADTVRSAAAYLGRRQGQDLRIRHVLGRRCGLAAKPR